MAEKSEGNSHLTGGKGKIKHFFSNLLMESFFRILFSLKGFVILLFSCYPLANGFEPSANAFFDSYCTKCHGPEKSKGKVTLHDMGDDFDKAETLERWELILDVLKGGEMPPEEEKRRPSEKDLIQITEWIENRLRETIASRAKNEREPLARRLSNFEYENTIRDLIGFRLDLKDNLPEDPQKPYRFNNTSEYMLIGPEQMDRYLENARKVMKSVIVNPEKPEIHNFKREWKPYGLDRGMGLDEIGVWGNRRHSPAGGMGLGSFPHTGEFKIRFQASTILPSAISGVTFRLIMGETIGINSSTQRVKPVGSVFLTNGPDAPEIFEFRGRIENFPFTSGREVNGRLQPDSRVITPQILYDDGTLNDGKRNLAMPRVVLNWMEFEAPIFETWPPSYHTRILFDSPLRDENPKAYVREVISRFASRAFRRGVTRDEVDRFEKIFNLVRPDVDSLESAMRETLAMVLVSPQFLYHTIADGDRTDKQNEIASRLSYFLWGSMPDDELISLAESKKLTEKRVMEREVRRLLADDRSKDFIKNFTMQWLSLRKMKTVPINPQLFPRFLYYVDAGERRGTEQPYRPTIRDFMLEETVGFIGELIRRNADVSNIIDSDFAWLNQPLAAHYGLEELEGNHFRAVSLQPQNKIGGLLTQGSVLIGNGTGTAPHPIYRAVWLREAILGDEVADPPADVPALSDSAGESAEKALTIRDLLAAHRQKESCNDCHARLDPWGIPFERYNAIGRYQPLVPREGIRVSGFNLRQHEDYAGYENYLKSINTEKVEASARLPLGPEVDGMDDLKEFLKRERRQEIAENILRRFLTYGVGRELRTRDRFVVEGILRRSSSNGHRLLDMIVAICTSEIFSNP